jgi:hypothetical protein
MKEYEVWCPKLGETRAYGYVGPYATGTSICGAVEIWANSREPSYDVTVFVATAGEAKLRVFSVKRDLDGDYVAAEIAPAPVEKESRYAIWTTAKGWQPLSCTSLQEVTAPTPREAAVRFAERYKLTSAYVVVASLDGSEISRFTVEQTLTCTAKDENGR